MTPLLGFTRVATVLALAVSSCDSPETARTKNVFGADDRNDAPATAPYSAVGRFDAGCTGTLIGKRLVLTAAHCVVDSGTGKVKTEMTYFRPSFRDGRSDESFWVEHFWLGSKQPEQERLKDWAVARLERNARPSYGFLAISDRAFPAASLPFGTSLIGYSIDRGEANSPSLAGGCSVREIVDGKLFHDCDGASGVSGGPLLNEIDGAWKIIGITVSEYRQGAADSVHRENYSRDYANVAVPAEQFERLARELVRTADDGATPTIPGAIDLDNPNQRDDEPGVTEPYEAAMIRPLNELTDRSDVLRHATADLNVASDDISSAAATIGDEPLRQAATTLYAASHRLDTTVGLALGGRLGTNYKARLFADYGAVKAQEQRLSSIQGGTNLTPRERLILALGQLRWVLQRFESTVFQAP